ncbi:TolC family protein [Tellurirhabdus rosea]|uniref:TolC family protein n=1 Tax=Tellurirhabdus rosea TaxID=2674997 RepID=UPI00224F83F6|nr:TolC family protein [Tellurirhabdus rosea]
MNKLLSPGKLLGVVALSVGITSLAMAQTPREFSLTEAIQFATQQNINVKNSQLDAVSAEARIKEVKSVSLPQVSVSGSLLDNLAIQTAFLPGKFFDPNAPDDAPPIPVRFGVTYAGSLQGAVNQLLFDASYRIGLKAADVYRELAQKNITASKISVAEQVAKAYYGVLVSQERMKLLDYNIGRLDTLLRETRALNQQGFVEKIDIDRLEVQLNNLQTEKQKVQNLVGLSYYLLKFQMGLNVNDPILLTDRIAQINVEEMEREINNSATGFDYANRIEFDQLQSQLKLAELDIQNTQKSYFPRLSAFFNYGYNNGRNKLSEMFTTKWFALSSVGLNLSVPVFDGFARKYRGQQQRITLQKAQNSGDLLKNSIDLQIRQSQITLQNNLQTLRTQQRNLDLANEILRVTRIKYKEGVGSNIEVLNAETSSREAQTNYYAALLDFMLAKVDLDKATGKLFAGN